MNQNEIQWDKLLKIKTTGRDDSNSDQYHYPYEPTPYCVLERLATSGCIGKKNKLLDYGTGKGRVCFYLSYQCRCRSIGIEFDEHLYDRAKSNQETAVVGGRIDFVMENAERYEFFQNAPMLNPKRKLITGTICGVRVENIEEPLMQEIRRLDKLLDELAKGKSMEKILRE